MEMCGFEPQTFRMQSGRSTTELHPLYVSSLVSIDIYNSFCYDYFVVEKCWRCGGSNPRPSACEADALPLSYIPCSYLLLLPLTFVKNSAKILFSDFCCNKSVFTKILLRLFCCYKRLEMWEIEP